MWTANLTVEIKLRFRDGLVWTADLTVEIREGSFNMTRGGGGMKILRGGSKKIRGGSKNLYTLNPKGRGGGS